MMMMMMMNANRNKRRLKFSIRSIIKAGISFVLFSVVCFSYWFTPGLFYQEFKIRNELVFPIKITLYAAWNDDKADEDSFLMPLYNSMSDTISNEYFLDNHLISSREVQTHGFNSDDMKPSQILATKLNGTEVLIEVLLERNNTFVIKSARKF